MAWRKRKTPAPEQPCDLLDPNRDRELDAAHAEADQALEKVRQQKVEQETIKQILKRIRERNHLAEIWSHDGIGI